MEMRLRHIDALRGLAMVMVVYHHVILRLFDTSSFINDICVYWRMPLFFFVSGFLCGGVYDTELLLRRFSSRLRYQLLPTIVMVLSYCWLISKHPYDMALEPTKMGYWFPWTLFEISVAYILYSWLMRRIGLSSEAQALGALMLALICGCICLTNNHQDHCAAYDIFSTKMLLYYSPYFLLGVIAKLCPKGWKTMTTDYWWIAASVLAFMLLCKWQWFDLGKPYLKGCVGLLASWSVFGLIHAKLANTRFMMSLEFVGRSTLPIYLLHYFIIALLNRSGINESMFVGLSTATIASIQVIISLAVLLSSIGIARLARRWPIVHQIALGRL